MPPMTMPPMGLRGNSPVNGSVMMVPVPVPMPRMVPVSNLPMSFPMGAPFPKQVQVPPGFKLVKIPEPKEISQETETKATETKATETKAAPYSEISDPSKTERKIFVGGLSPATTEESL